MDSVTRLLKKEDMGLAKELWCFDFETDEPFLSWYFDEFLIPENSVGIFEGSKLVSMLQLNPYTVRIGAVNYDTAYIVGVISHPDYRRKGLMDILMPFAYEEMARRNQHVALLMPFDTFFYRRFGLDLCYSQLKYVLPSSTFKSFDFTDEYYFEEITVVDDCSNLSFVYNEFTKNLNGFIVRSDNNWACILTDLFCYNGKAIVVYNSNDLPVGYLLYTVSNSKVRVVDIGYIGEYYESVLFGYLAKHVDSFDKAIVPAPSSSSSVLFFKDTISPEPTNANMLVPFMSGRIIDVKKAFECRKFFIEGQFVVKVSDDNISANNDTFLFKFNGEGCNVSVFETASWDFSCTINVLSQLFFQGISFGEALSRRLVDLKNSDVLEISEKVFVKGNNYINEYF